MADKITLADGTEYEVNWAGEGAGQLFLDLRTHATIPELVPVFCDPLKMAKVTYEYALGTLIYEGYNRLVVVNDGRPFGTGLGMQFIKEGRV